MSDLFKASALRYDDVVSLRDRLMAKVVVPDDPAGCWQWKASTSRQGYARLGGTGAHRFSFVLFVRDLEAGETVDHVCRNRRCVSPFHLEAVPLAVNVMRGNGVCAQHSRKTSCPNGHPYTTKRRSDGKTQRYCVTCDRAYKREWARRHNGYLPERYRV